jgi:UMF1 family MFS transporter
MTTAEGALPLPAISEREYKRRIRAWTMYDWANSAFATTILAAVLPIYYSQVAGATLPSEATATAYWSLGLSLSLFVVAVLAPILGTVSDVTRAKKPLLTAFVTLGVTGTGLLALVGTGDWLLASVLFVIARIGFTSSTVFYDALLPHVAREEDRDMVSVRGYALGYLGGGLLLAINVVMLAQLPGTWGARLSFVSVAVWWLLFSIPIFTRVPEPPAAPATLDRSVLGETFRRLGETLRDIRQYRELFKFLIAFLIYNDGIGTIIGVAAIYGAELGLGTTELIPALLLVQFAGIPFSLIFGRLPTAAEKRRPFFLAFILFNLIALPAVGVAGARLLPETVTGVAPPPYESVGDSVGQGEYGVDDDVIAFEGAWEAETVDIWGKSATYAVAEEAGAAYTLPFNGQQATITYSTGPDRGIWQVFVDGEPALDPDTGLPLAVGAYHSTVRYGVPLTIDAGAPGQHVLTIVNSGERAAESGGTLITLAGVAVEPPLRQSSLPIIVGMIAAVEAAGALLALLLGPPLLSGLANSLDTRRSVILALVVYAAIAVWGFFINSMIEFWFLAWMVAIVQGGSQGLSRSLYASLSPAAKSGEFFGLFGVMEKFSAVMGPILFAAAVALFESSRPAVLSLVVFFVVGITLLSRVDVAEGVRVAQAEDAALLGGQPAG